MTTEAGARQAKRFVMGMACLLFVFSASMGFLLTQISLGRYNLPEEGPVAAADAEPQPRQFCWVEQYQLCQLYDLDCDAVPLEPDENQEAAETLLQELSLAEVASRYPMPQWTVTETDNVVTISHMLEGLCDRHRQMYHLGVNENDQYVAVYYGPSAVGSAAGAFLVTDVPVQRLSPEQQNELQSGQYQYYSQDELISMLDNISEL